MGRACVTRRSQRNTKLITYSSSSSCILLLHTHARTQRNMVLFRAGGKKYIHTRFFVRQRKVFIIYNLVEFFYDSMENEYKIISECRRNEYI